MANDGPSADEPVVRQFLKAASYAQNSDDPKKV